VGRDVHAALADGFARLAAQKKRQFERAAASRKQQVSRIRPPSRSLAPIVERNVGLIRSLSATAAADLRKLLGENHGLNRDQLAEIIQDRFGVTRSRAEFWAVDQTLKANAELALTEARAAGFTHYRWSTSKDSRVRRDEDGKGRPDHVHLEGTTHALDTPPVVEEATGRRCHPGQDYRCRCVMVPLFPDEVPSTKPKPKPKPKPKAPPRPVVTPAPVTRADQSPEVASKPRVTAAYVDGLPATTEQVRVFIDSGAALQNMAGQGTFTLRAATRDLIRHYHPELQSRDVSRALPLQDMVVTDTIPGAAAYHDWNGKVALSQDTRSNFDAFGLKAERGDWSAIATDEWLSLRTVIHEELHGMSPLTPSAYIPGEASANIEEVLTEVLARRNVRKLASDVLERDLPIELDLEKVSKPGDSTGTLWAKDAAGRRAHGPYGKLILDVLDGLDFDFEALETAALKMRSAAGYGKHYAGNDQVDHLLSVLPPAKAAKLKTHLLKVWLF
jgi:SPP1 gp7 family putative phage head morphogenesis protein